jgi:hypothetical protein
MMKSAHRAVVRVKLFLENSHLFGEWNNFTKGIQCGKRAVIAIYLK